ncbi:MAG: N-acetylmuramoyl-L-alanine amidase [Rubrimonas sp.]|uniref:N-acetylmuramoyl-L-alanine amidase n=1 Tax=Rubrimonas sp. TaxID=2036015 RepID=UPI002FDE582C
MIEAPSPNHGPRRGGAAPDLVVLHHTAMDSAEAALARLRDPAAEVSAHWLIAEDGRSWRLVDETRRAWHAGAGAWGDCADVNSRSIGVELANPGDAPFPEPQMAALEALLRPILARWPIPPERVIGHACMAPGRKADPSRRFDWRRLARAGLAIWAEPVRDPAPADPAPFRAAARRFGYPLGPGEGWDAEARAVAAAFRLRFRPSDDADGPLDAGGLAQLQALAARWPAR